MLADKIEQAGSGAIKRSPIPDGGVKRLNGTTGPQPVVNP